MRYAVLFPGQGSQSVGMGADVFDAYPELLGSDVDAVLGWSLRSVCIDGPDDELTRTDRAQPALFAVAFALWKAFSSLVAEKPYAVAGHSLGEYTALAAAGVIAFDDGIRLVSERGLAMDAAASESPGAMAALMGATIAQAEEITADRRNSGGALWVANVNSPGQIVVAGATTDIEWLAENARELGVRRTIPLKVAGAFHSPMMASAQRRLGKALSDVEYREADFPVWSNVTAAPVDDVAASLAQQLVSRVRFADTLEGMAAEGIDAFVHVGPGNVTAGMAARTVPDATTWVVSTIDEAAEVAGALAIQ